jgi:hypothetical protein
MQIQPRHSAWLILLGIAVGWLLVIGSRRAHQRPVSEKFSVSLGIKPFYLPAHHPRGDSGSAVLDAAGEWSARCRIHRPCETAAAILPPCPQGMRWESWEAAAVRGDSLVGQAVQVRGRLVADVQIRTTLMGCSEETCCNSVWRKLLIADKLGFRQLILEGQECSGDASRQCCPLPALGQAVVASGTVKAYEATPTGIHLWRLAVASLCEAGP